MNSDSEKARLEQLKSYRILDTDPEKRFDDLTYLASYICQTPVAMINLIDEDRQFTKSVVGAKMPDIPREAAFCAQTIMEREILIIEDLQSDYRFSQNPFVTQAPYARFYAGVPVFSGEGMALGSLCVLDRVPRKLSDDQKNALKALAEQVHDQMELRKNLFELRITVNEREKAYKLLLQNEQLFKKVLETAREGILIEKNERVFYMNTAYAELFGREAAEMLGLHIRDLAAPEDVDRLLDYGRQRAEGKNPPSHYNFKIKHKDAHLIPVEAVVSDFYLSEDYFIVTAVRDITERQLHEAERERLITELQSALSKVKTLGGLLPICSSCKKIRDDKGYWNQLETYIETHTEADFTHGICPECAHRLYPDLYEEN